MTKTMTGLMTVLAGFLLATVAIAHEGEVHHKCKKGYVMTDDHKCVRAPQ